MFRKELIYYDIGPMLAFWWKALEVDCLKVMKTQSSNFLIRLIFKTAQQFTIELVNHFSRIKVQSA